MTGAASRRKGNAAETAVAKWLRDNGWPDARTTRDARGGSQGGADITGVTGWAIEVKHHAKLEPARWWQQAVDWPSFAKLNAPIADGLGASPLWIMRLARWQP